MKKLLATAAVVFAMATADAQECRPVAEIVGAISTAYNDVLAVRLVGREAANFIAAWDALPPESQTDADQVLVFQRPGVPVALVWFVKGDCAVEHVMLPIEVLFMLGGRPA